MRGGPYGVERNRLNRLGLLNQLPKPISTRRARVRPAARRNWKITYVESVSHLLVAYSDDWRRPPT